MSAGPEKGFFSWEWIKRLDLINFRDKFEYVQEVSQ